MHEAPTGPGRLVLVVGPSGAGKDTLMAAARRRLPDDVVFPRRLITRPADPDIEDHDTIGEAEFDAMVAAGEDCLSWRAHGLGYAIPGAATRAIRAGRTVVVNASRSVVAEARRRYAGTTVVLVSAPPELLARRLGGRGRETAGAVAARLARAGTGLTEGDADVEIVNDGTVEAGAAALVAAVLGARKGGSGASR